MSDIKINNFKISEVEGLFFTVPAYQRAYSWNSENVEVLLQDLNNADSSCQYYIGNIVVEEVENGRLEVIDGQQRLTTIYLIALIAKWRDFLQTENQIRLDYQIREEDNCFLEELTKIEDITLEKIKEKQRIFNADLQFVENLEMIISYLDENIDNVDQFLGKMKDILKFSITFLPSKLDITKYFEVMNSRGKQLEHHEILKSRIGKNIPADIRADYMLAWDYCSNMSIYLSNNEKLSHSKVIKFYSTKEETIKDLKFESSNDGIKSIKDMLKPSSEISGGSIHSHKIDKYDSIISFPMFLLHCLRLYKFEETQSFLSTLDDKKLLAVFENNQNVLEGNEKEFIDFVFRQRILFDYFIFKRNDNEPEIKSLGYREDSKRKGMFYWKLENSSSFAKELLMIELLHQLTAPQRLTQDWISLVLHVAGEKLDNFKESNFNDVYQALHEKLEVLDASMSKKRISDTKESSLVDILKNELMGVGNTFETNKSNFEVLNKGTSTPHYWFYKLDYLLYKDYKNEKRYWQNLIKLPDASKFKYSDIESEYRLSRLNSIEHIHPQSKAEDWKNDVACKTCHADRRIDCFGNLALISNHMNSSLSDKIDEKRWLIQAQLDKKTIESLKMLLAYSKYENWNENNCKSHHMNMMKILNESLN